MRRARGARRVRGVASTLRQRAPTTCRRFPTAEARSDELARTIAQEVGMPLKLAGRIQAGLPIANFAN